MQVKGQQPSCNRTSALNRVRQHTQGDTKIRVMPEDCVSKPSKLAYANRDTIGVDDPHREVGQDCV